MGLAVQVDGLLNGLPPLLPCLHRQHCRLVRCPGQLAARRRAAGRVAATRLGKRVSGRAVARRETWRRAIRLGTRPAGPLTRLCPLPVLRQLASSRGREGGLVRDRGNRETGWGACVPYFDPTLTLLLCWCRVDSMLHLDSPNKRASRTTTASEQKEMVLRSTKEEEWYTSAYPNEYSLLAL